MRRRFLTPPNEIKNLQFKREQTKTKGHQKGKRTMDIDDINKIIK